MKLNLIERQQAAIDGILALGENGRRAMGYGLTFLNKKRRGLTRIRRQFERDAARMGYSPKAIIHQWQDVKDMVILEVGAE